MRSTVRLVARLGAACAALALAPALAAAQAAGGGSASATQAMTPEQREVYAVVERIFEGMRTRDTTMMRAGFDPIARMLGVDSAGTVRAMPVDGWITGIAKAPAGLLLDERLYEPVVHVDGNLAQVWVKYDFYAGEKFSHCGVDALELTRTRAGWKITQVADTRRKERCGTPGAPGSNE